MTGLLLSQIAHGSVIQIEMGIAGGTGGTASGQLIINIRLASSVPIVLHTHTSWVSDTGGDGNHLFRVTTVWEMRRTAIMSSHFSSVTRTPTATQIFRVGSPVGGEGIGILNVLSQIVGPSKHQGTDLTIFVFNLVHG